MNVRTVIVGRIVFGKSDDKYDLKKGRRISVVEAPIELGSS